MKKTKVIVKKQKQKQPRQKQKQKQNVSVNVNIDQSKRTTQRKPKVDKTTAQSTTTAHGENYVRSNPYSYLPPVVYQPPFNQVYGQLQPVGNTSDSMSRMITNEQNYNSVVPRSNVPNDSLFSTGPTYNFLSVAAEARNIRDEIKSAEAYANTRNNATVEFLDDEQDDEQVDEPVPALESNEDVLPVETLSVASPPPPPIETQSQSQSQSQVINAPIDDEKVNRTYLTVLSAERVRDYAKKLKIETQKPSKEVGVYKDISKKDLISAIIKKLNENK
jgi:hypothetical protein